MGYIRFRTKGNLILPNSKIITNLGSFRTQKAGRNNTGRISFYHRGGGLRRKYRLIDYHRIIWNMRSQVLYNEYDPNRTSLISLLCFHNGILSYILSTNGIISGDRLYSTSSPKYAILGNCLPLFSIPEGTSLHSIERYLGKGGTIVRSAGTTSLYVKNFGEEKILLRLPSKEEILIHKECSAVLGQISRGEHMIQNFYKAGQRRRRNFKPRVRGVAKNPVDHPHGGGGGRCLVTPWARVAKTQSTRKTKRLNVNIIKSRKQKKRK
jgi:large subunit ribosomal protein L2